MPDISKLNNRLTKIMKYFSNMYILIIENIQILFKLNFHFINYHFIVVIELLTIYKQLFKSQLNNYFQIFVNSY